MRDIDIAHWRMHNLLLSGEPLDSPEDVVRWLVAVQSQDYGPAKWSVGMRVHGASDGALDQAMAEGAILRTHVLRPTWHFVAPEDIRWMLELTGPRVQVANGHPYRLYELDGDTLARSNELLVDALVGGNQRMRKELGAMLETAGISTAGQRLPYILMNAELNGLICSGALKGKQQTYALLDERAPRARRLEPDEALAELTLRYFTSHGPATERDFQAWSSLTLADIRRGLAMVASRLENADINGLPYWFAEPFPNVEPVSPTAHLLQGYDEYFMGYRESRHVVDLAGFTDSLPNGRSIFNGVVVLDGQIAGHWKRAFKRREVVFDVALYRPLDDAQRGALEAAAGRQGEFLGLDARVVTAHL
jgi:hypothetical protein